MRQIFNLACVFIFLAFGISCKSIKSSVKNVNPAAITILSYNVRNCIGLDNVVNYERVANVITKINPDIVAIQELDSNTVSWHLNKKSMHLKC